MKSIILKVFILLSICSLAKAETMRIAVSNDNELPYREMAPVQSKLTVLNAILGRLLHADINYDLSSGHLESFKWDYSKKAYILKLKKNLYFHNGRKVTAKDLEFSILRGFFSKNRHWFEVFFSNISGIEKVNTQKYTSGLIDGVKVLSDDSLQVILKKPNPSFLHSITITYFSLVPIEELESDYISWKKYPVGVGPYRVSKVNTDNSIELEKVKDSNQKVILTVNGQEKKSDIILTNIEENKEVEISSSIKTTSVTGIFFNYNNPIINDLNFRKAVDLMLDRKKLIGDISLYKENNQFLASHFWGRLKETESQNIKSAKYYLSKVQNLDLKKTYKIPVFNSYFGDGKYGNYLTQLTNQFKELGMNIEFYDSKDKFLDKKDNDTLFRIISLGADVMEPLVLFGLMRGKSPYYPHYPEDKTFDKLFEDAISQTTQEGKIAKVIKLSRHYYENRFSIPLFERKLLYGHNSQRIKSLGKQDGGLTFLIEKIEMTK
jgi:ABC-type transport system substrate-binding protein